MTLHSYIQSLDLQLVKQACRDYELYESVGSMGNTVLRDRTKYWVETEHRGIAKMGLALWIDHFAFECFRRLAKGQY